MRRLRAAFGRIRALLQRDRVDHELADELQSHLTLHIDDNLRAGMSPEDARRHALIKLGGVSQIEERHRRTRGIPFVEHLMRDSALSLRTLRASPAFTSVAVLTVALGIGANTAIFTVVNAVLFRPLPVERPGELVAINTVRSGFTTFSYPDYRDFRDANTLFTGIAATRFAPVSFDANGSASRVWGSLVSGNYFDMIGVRAVVGRTLTPSDDRIPGGHPVLVLSNDAWRSRFGSDPSIVGRTVKINGAPFTILGVMPPGFYGTERLFTPELWMPIMMVAHVESGNDWLERRRTQNVFLLGRRRPDVTNAQAEASLNPVARDLARQFPETHEGMRVALSPPGLMGSLFRGPALQFSGALLGVAGLVLLLACTNLTGLLLARSTDRRREMAIKVSLGAGRADLIRRSLVESAMLSAMGAVTALLLAGWLGAFLRSWRLPVDIPLTFRVGLDARVWLFALGLAALCTLLIGLLPALQGTRVDVMPALRDETAEWRRGWHIRDVIVGLQVALSTILLIGSLLVVRSLQHAATVDIGFNSSGVAIARVDLGLQGYDRARALAFQRRIIDAIAVLPGVQSVAVANSTPLNADVSTMTVFVDGKPAPRGANAPHAIYYQVSPGFFRTIQTRLVAGRDFLPTDATSEQMVAVVNQAFVRQYLGDGNPIGMRFRSGRTSGHWTEVIGVVQDGKYQSLGEGSTPVAFHDGQQWYNPTTSILARTSLSDGEAVELVRRSVHAFDAGLSVFEAGPCIRCWRCRCCRFAPRPRCLGRLARWRSCWSWSAHTV
jgi:predicted permease